MVTNMAILRESDRTFLRQFFEERLVNEVEVHLFVSKKDCEYCEETKELLTEVASLNPKIKLQVHDFELEKDVANSMGVDKVPATVIKSVNGTMVYYFGIPSGYEFRSFMEDLVDASRGSTDLSEEIRSQVKRINEPVEIKVFVTPTCPYCPRAVRTAHKFAFENPNIKALMIESLEFSELAQQYNVMAVPKIVINDKVEFEGAMPENFFIEQVFAALDQAY
jgi:glutaredoxin-like protein